jgi:serine/threonine-protein kinase
MICSSCGARNPGGAVTCAKCGFAMAPAPTISPGFLLASRYEILKVLGRGGMGMVYQAHDRLLDETVAIKVLRPEAAASPEIAQRFRAEIKIARAVSHKNVCRIHEYGEDRGIRYISMAYVDGVDLKQVLRQRGPLAPDDAFEVAIRVAEALQAIHDEGIIHRDLKTPNIMLDSRGVVRLMDFGIAKQGTAPGLSMTVTGEIIGTPEYMSPEQVQALRLDGRSDIYSLGVVVFELFTGKTPFRADTPLGTVLKHLNETPPLDDALLPPALVPVLRRALAKPKEERHPDAREMALALEEARALTPEAGRRDGLAQLVLAAQAVVGPTQDLGPAPETDGLIPIIEHGGPIASAPATRATGPPPVRRRGVALAVIAVAALGAVAGVVLRIALRPTGTSAGLPAPASAPSLGPTPTPSALPAPATAPAQTPIAARAPLASPRPDRTRAAEEVRAAQASFNQGRYDEALARAEAALRLNPSDPAALTLRKGATAGREADRSLAAAETALGRAEYDGALKDVEAAARAAPWDVRAAQARARIQDERARARPPADGRVERLLADGDSALEAQNFDTAIARYDEVLKLDSRNAIARMGRATAVNAKVSRAAAVRVPAGHSFVAGQTVAESPETRPDTALASSFEESPQVKVTRDTQAAVLPGRLEFKTEPEAVKPGEPYTLEIRFVNTGTAPIEIKDLVVTTTVNGRRATGPVTPTVSTVAPGQGAALLSLPDRLREDLRSWSLEVSLRTSRGETYRNQLVWK